MKTKTHTITAGKRKLELSDADFKRVKKDGEANVTDLSTGKRFKVEVTEYVVWQGTPKP